MGTDAPTESGTNAQAPEALPVVRAQVPSDRLTNLHGLDGNGRERTVTVEAKLLRSRVVLEEGSPT